MSSDLTEVDPTPTDHQRIRVLEIGHMTLVAQQAEVAVAMRAVEECLRKGELRMGSMETELASNSKITAENSKGTLEVLNILSAAKGAFTVLGWLGAAAKWTAAVGGALTSIYVAAYMVTHNGKPPWP